MQAANGRRPRRRVIVPRQNFPRGVRLEYQRAILMLVDEAAEKIREQILPNVRRLVDQTRQTDPSVRQDAPADEVAAALDDLSDTVIAASRPGITATASTTVRRTAEFNGRELDRVFERTLGVGIPAAEPYLDDFIVAATRENVRRVTALLASEFDEAQNVILSGFRRGIRFEEIAQTLESRFNIIENRARLIARDQVASLNGELNRLRQTNIGVTSYVWRTSQDDDVRPSHEELDGEVFTWAQGSPEGHPGEPINCFPGDTPLSVAGTIGRVFRRYFEGELVTMKTKAGTLRCTPNHPILTGRGWRIAEELKKGDYVVEASLDPAGLRHDYRNETSFDQAWDLACRVGLRNRGTARFDSDPSPHDEVDVVDIDGDLGIHRPALCADCFEKLALAEADLARSGPGLLPKSSSTPRRPTDGIVGSGHAGRPLGAGHPPLHCKHCLGATPRFASPFDEPSRKDVPRYPDLIGEGLRRFPSGIAFHQLSEVPGRVEFRGHVFNLEAIGHWYLAGAIIVHNCRCIAEPVLGDLIEATEPGFL